MRSLLGRDEADEISPLLCAFELGRAELQDERWQVRYAALCSEVRRQGMWIWFAGHCTNGIARKQRDCRVQTRVSPVQFLTCSVTASGPMRRPAASSLFCFIFDALRVTVSICDGPSVNAELRPWESRPLA